MPVLRINATSSGVALHGKADAQAHVLQLLDKDGGPAIIMLHGYKYAPHLPKHSPHRKVFSDARDAWPAQLGFGSGRSGEGFAIGFGWYARGPLQSAYDRATRLGETLAVLIAMLKGRANRPVHILAHSLGAQAALSALAHLPSNSVDRIVLLTGASFSSHAERMLATPAGRTTEVFNITSRENDLFDLAFEALVRPPTRGDLTVGSGIKAPNARTLQVDCDVTLAGLGELGYPIASSARNVCHWSAYKRPGVMRLYQDLLRAPEDLSFDRLDAHLPMIQSPRWSRLACASRGLKGQGLPNLLSRLPRAPRLGKRILRQAPLEGKPHEHAC